jgi:hypothetical protein
MESLLVTYSELEERLEKISERNFYGLQRKVKRPIKKKAKVSDLLS